MSFIYENDQLIKLLLEAGDSSINKKAQTGMLPDEKVSLVKSIPNYELALKLLYNIQRDIDPLSAPSADTPIGVEGNPNAEIPATTAHFRTLGDFLNWAATNKLTWKGKRFAWTPEEVALQRGKPNDPTQSAWVFTSLPFNRNDRRIDRQPEEKSVYADKDALVAYLSALRDGPEAKGNNVLRFMLASLIGETNGYLRIKGDKPINTKTSDTPQDNLDPRLVVDVLPSVLSMETLNEGLNLHPFQNVSPDIDGALTVSDLKDAGSFKAWLRNRKVKVTVPAQGGQPAKSVVMSADPTDAESDPCLAVHILYQRATKLASVAEGDDRTVPNYSKAVALYVLAITTYGKTVVGKDGKPCAVVRPGTTTGVAPGTQPGAGGVGTGKSPSTQQLNDVIQYMPLNLNSINLNSIDSFFRAYEKLVTDTGSSEEQAIKEHHAYVSTAWQNIKPMLTKSDYRFSLIGGAETVVPWLRDPRSSYYPFVKNLSDILNSTFQTIGMFYDSYVRSRSSEDRVIFDPQQKSIVEGQTPIYQSNMRIISRWLNDAGRVQGFKK